MTSEESQLILNRLDELSAKMDALGERLASRDAQPVAEPQEFLTVRQAAAYLNVSESVVRRMKHLHVRRGRSIRLRRSSLDRTFRCDPFATDKPAKRKRN